MRPPTEVKGSVWKCVKYPKYWRERVLRVLSRREAGDRLITCHVHIPGMVWERAQDGPHVWIQVHGFTCDLFMKCMCLHVQVDVHGLTCVLFWSAGVWWCSPSCLKFTEYQDTLFLEIVLYRIRFLTRAGRSTHIFISFFFDQTSLRRFKNNT